MGWYGIFLIPKLRLVFSLRSVDEGTLLSYFDSLERFFDKYEKLREDMEYVQTTSEEVKTFSAKTTAKMFGIIDEFGCLPELSDSKFLLYFLHKFGFESEYKPEDKVDLEKLKKAGWKVFE